MILFSQNIYLALLVIWVVARSLIAPRSNTTAELIVLRTGNCKYISLVKIYSRYPSPKKCPIRISPPFHPYILRINTSKPLCIPHQLTNYTPETLETSGPPPLLPHQNFSPEKLIALRTCPNGHDLLWISVSTDK